MMNAAFHVAVRAAKHPFLLALLSHNLSSQLAFLLPPELPGQAADTLAIGYHDIWDPCIPRHILSHTEEVKVRKNNHFHPRRRGPILFPDSLSIRLLHVTIPSKPALRLKAVSKLSSQARRSKPIGVIFLLTGSLQETETSSRTQSPIFIPPSLAAFLAPMAL